MMKCFVTSVFLIISQIVFSQTTDFTFESVNSSNCIPARFQFTPATEANPVGYVWDFGNGSTSNSRNPAYTYTTSGVYQVKLIVIYEQKAVTVTKTVSVFAANNVGIAADRTFICTAGDVSFTASGNAQVQYEWDFGDGSTSVTANGNTSHRFNDQGKYTVTLKGVDANGCAASASVPVELKDPSISGSVTGRSGCIPATSSFSASVTLPAGSTVASYDWDFGDGQTLTTSTNNTNHSYTVKDKYDPTLSITTSEGCTANFNFPAIAFGEPPTNISAYPDADRICGSDTAVFHATAQNANQYYWRFDDGTTATVNTTQISHKYATLGTKNVIVTPMENGCAGSQATFPVDVVGLIAGFNFSADCTDKNEISFINESLGTITSYEWDFNDGSVVDTDSDPVHTFPVSGAFNTKLTIRDNVSGCSDIYTRNIYTATPTLTTLDTFVCRNETVNFRVRDSYNNPAVRYTYYLGDTIIGPPASSSVNTKYKDFGLHQNYVIIDNGAQYCNDTLHLDFDLMVRGPRLDFDVNPSICTYDSTVVTNNSTSFLAGDSISNIIWMADDSLYSQQFQPPVYKFTGSGNHLIKLFATDVNGCADSLVKPVRVNSIPFLRVVPESVTLCQGQTDSIMAFYTGSLQWNSTLPLPCNTCDTVLVTPPSSGFYAAEALSSAGCYARDTIHFKVYEPFNAVAVNPVSYVCPGDTLMLQINPADLRITWQTTSGNTPPVGYDPVITVSQSEEYKAIMTDSAGCFTDTATFNVTAKSPAFVDAGNDTTVNYFGNFYLNPDYSNNIVKYEWFPPGDLDCIFCPSPTGRAENSYNYLVRVTTDSGCVAMDSVKVTIDCNDASILVPNAFTPNNDNLNEVIYPIGRGVSSIRRFSVYNRFGEMVFNREHFSPNDKHFGWDGKIRGEPAPVAVYVYTIEAVCDKGENIFKKGTITLIR